MPPASVPGTALRLVDVVKRYGSLPAVAGVSLEVRPGELVTLLGPSGSGKTTTLKLVAGFEPPDAGRILFGDRDMTFVPAHRRDVGMVFQDLALFPHMSVYDNIAFPLRMRGRPAPEIRERVMAALELVRLGGLAARRPAELSGGQQQRVAVARAVVYGPRLLLFDEPFGALDRKLREEMQVELKQLQHRLGVTTLFVTHDQEEALVLSDRIAVMNNGLIEQVGTPADLYERPRNAFVAAFIGESNLLRGQVVGASAGRVLVELDGGLTVKVASEETPAEGQTVGVLIRPERLRLPANRGQTENEIDARVAQVVYLGSQSKYHLEAAAGCLTLKARWPSNMPESPRPGDSVLVGWSAEDSRLVGWTARDGG